MPPQDHPRYDEVKFLEGPAATTGVINLDEEVRRMARSDELPTRALELAALLATRPHTDVRPLLTLLDGANSPGWMFWRKSPPVAQTVAALRALTPIREPRVLERARRLSSHPDKAIAQAAQAMLEATSQ